MRTIKFRVWDKANNIFMNSPFVGGHPLFMLNNKFELGYIQDSFDGQPDYEYIFQQFTGLKDSKGNDIYEGDIVTFGATYPKWVVSYNDGCGRFEAGSYSFNTHSDGSVNSSGLRVIGNIIEHKHLLS